MVSVPTGRRPADQTGDPGPSSEATTMTVEQAPQGPVTAKGAPVDRTAWLRERRRMAEERFDTLYAPTYDRDEGDIGPTHRRFVAALVRRCPPGGRVVDAACGTGAVAIVMLDIGPKDADKLRPADD
jgi:hypothetical protein